MPGSAGKDRGGPYLSRVVRRRRRRACLPWRAAPALALIAILASCSINYKEAGSEAQAEESIPDTVAVNVRHLVHKDGHLTVELEAARAESYNSRNQSILTDVRFTTYDDTGAVVSEGNARRVVYHTDTENAEISGGVHVHSSKEKGDVSADSLSWQNKTRVLTAPPQEAVTIRKDDGSVLRGTGFTGDFTRRELNFSGPVQGSYVSQQR